MVELPYENEDHQYHNPLVLTSKLLLRAAKLLQLCLVKERYLPDEHHSNYQIHRYLRYPSYIVNECLCEGELHLLKVALGLQQDYNASESNHSHQ